MDSCVVGSRGAMMLALTDNRNALLDGFDFELEQTGKFKVEAVETARMGCDFFQGCRY
jgi:hypothetical protein